MATAPGGPNGSRRHGPASAIAATTAVPARVSPYCQIAGWPSSHHGTTLARNDPAGHRPGDGPGGSPQRGPAPPPFRLGAPEDQADGGERGHVGERVGPEEDGVRARPHLSGGVLADQPADGGGERAPAAAGDRRAGHAGGNGLAAPAEHGGRQVGQHHHPGLPGRGGVQHARPVPRPADRRDLQMRRHGGRPGRGHQQGRPGRQVRGDGGELGVGVLDGGGPRARPAAGSEPRSTTVSGHRASSGRLRAGAVGRAGR